ncbi:MAG: 2-C-methyl-D-erythritol 4-phosphate cytidylyltransferase [Candidatus Omnitrophota bacterium]
MKNKVVAIVLAGGTGVRMGKAVPKQFLEVAHKPIIVHTLEHFEKSDLISDIVVVCHAEHIGDLESLVKKSGIKKVCTIIPGGKTRQESSFAGIKSCPPDTEFVLIHDAVRPFVNDKIIKDVFNAAKKYGAAGPVIDVEDTIIEEKNGFIKSIPDRRYLKRIQTPQGFCYETILKSHERGVENNFKDVSDDCGLVISMKKPVKLVKGDPLNFKITNQRDMFSK